MAQTRLDRALIHVSGPEAHAFLQGLLTQNVERLRDEKVLYAGLLTPQGKVSADMFLWAADDGIVIDADAGRGEDLLRKLTLYKLRAQVSVDVRNDLSVLVSEAAFAGAAPDPRLAAIGWRALLSASEAQEAATDPADYTARRIALGVPDLATDANVDEVFALEALFEELNGVDFQKGCFVGQENVSRMKRRATTRKKFCRIEFEGEAPAYGTPVRAGEAEFGSVRTSAGGQALALLRLDRALAAPAPLLAGEIPVRLAPPDWLILPETD